MQNVSGYKAQKVIRVSNSKVFNTSFNTSKYILKLKSLPTIDRYYKNMQELHKQTK